MVLIPTEYSGSVPPELNIQGLYMNKKNFWTYDEIQGILYEVAAKQFHMIAQRNALSNLFVYLQQSTTENKCCECWDGIINLPHTQHHHHASIYRQFSNISRTQSQNIMFLVLPCCWLCPIHWSHVLSWEWRCSWSSTDRRCSYYVWVINNFIDY